MWDKFGEFDSAEELNRAAAAQLEEGDTEAVLAIAKENGIDPDEATELWDCAGAQVNAMHRRMEEIIYGVGPKAKEGLDDILNASSELQKVVRKLKEQL